MKNNEIAVQSTAETLCVFNDSKIGSQYVSFSPEDTEGKIKLYNAINSPDTRLGDVINTPINLRDVVVCKVKLNDKSDDEDNPFVNNEREAFRTILIDEDGRSYTATSTGIYNSVANLRAVFGNLHFEPALPIKVKQVKVKNGNTLSLEILTAKKGK